MGSRTSKQEMKYPNCEQLLELLKPFKSAHVTRYRAGEFVVEGFMEKDIYKLQRRLKGSRFVLLHLSKYKANKLRLYLKYNTTTEE